MLENSLEFWKAIAKGIEVIFVALHNLLHDLICCTIMHSNSAHLYMSCKGKIING